MKCSHQTNAHSMVYDLNKPIFTPFSWHDKKIQHIRPVESDPLKPSYV